MEDKRITEYYKLYGELVEFIGDFRWNAYIRHKRVTEGI